MKKPLTKLNKMLNFLYSDMIEQKSKQLYDPTTGSHLMTVKEAAEYLDYHPFSVYRLIWSGELKPVKTAGKVKLFLTDDLAKFKASGKWAKRKQSLDVPDEAPKTDLEATISVSWGSYKVKKFTWEQVPLLRAGIIQKYGDVAFKITIRTSEIDGLSWVVDYYPAQWTIPGAIQKVLKNRKEKK